jgi:hypothetical protein
MAKKIEPLGWPYSPMYINVREGSTIIEAKCKVLHYMKVRFDDEYGRYRHPLKFEYDWDSDTTFASAICTTNEEARDVAIWMLKVV